MQVLKSQLTLVNNPPNLSCSDPPTNGSQDHLEKGQLGVKGRSNLDLSNPITLETDFDANNTSLDLLPQSSMDTVPNPSAPSLQNTVDDAYFVIKNIDTGESFDLREKDVESKVIPENNIKIEGTPWQCFWKRTRENNENMWDAAECGDVKKIKELLDPQRQLYPAEIDSRGLDGWTALHSATNYGHYEVVEALIRFGGDMNAKTSMGRTCLHLGCMRGYLDILELLVRSGCQKDSQDNEGNTALHYASEHGFGDLVKFLLDSDAKYCIKNQAKMTCIDVANSLEIKKIFEERGLVNEKTSCSFGRLHTEDGVLYNGRTDLIGKLLFMKDFYLQKKNKQNDKKNIVHFTNLQESPKEVVNPSSFIYHSILGSGSFGEVFLVEKKSSGDLYAMKVLRKEKIMKKNLTRYAKTERIVLSVMSHPFIVKIHYAFQTQTKLYMALQYCPGGDLASRIFKEKKLSENIARIYAAEITLALEALHQQDIIYRDLKPANVVLDQDGHALLTDFGLSKQGIRDGTTTASFCGSIAYLAPEMLKRTGHNKMVDWYLLGVIIYEMLMGIPPYYNPDREEMFMNIRTGNNFRLKSVSKEAESLIKMLLIRDPNKRLGSQNGAKDIKNHAWFRAINWKDALARKLKPPVPRRRSNQLKQMMNMNFDDSPTSKLYNYIAPKEHLEGWTFIEPTDHC